MSEMLNASTQDCAYVGECVLVCGFDAEPRHVPNLQNPLRLLRSARREVGLSGEKMMRVVFSPPHETEWENLFLSSFGFSHDTTEEREAGEERNEYLFRTLLLVTAKTRRCLSAVNVCGEIYQNSLPSVATKIRRFKGCEYVYVNGKKSLKIYIYLWIFLTMAGAEQSVVVVTYFKDINFLSLARCFACDNEENSIPSKTCQR